MGPGALARHEVAVGRPSLLDEIGGRGQGLGSEQVARADLGAEPARATGRLVYIETVVRIARDHCI